MSDHVEEMRLARKAIADNHDRQRRFRIACEKRAVELHSAALFKNGVMTGIIKDQDQFERLMAEIESEASK